MAAAFNERKIGGLLVDADPHAALGVVTHRGHHQFDDSLEIDLLLIGCLLRREGTQRLGQMANGVEMEIDPISRSSERSR